MTEIKISDYRRIAEIGAVVGTGVGKVIFMDLLTLKLPFIVFSIIAWAGYIWFRNKSEPRILKYWGFRSDNFWKTCKLVFPFGAIAILSFFFVGFLLETINITWHIIPILIIYPVWGVIQQFLIIVLIAGNLQDFEKKKVVKPLSILIAALVFAAIHYPFIWLIIGTFILALFYGFIFLKSRNVWVLGLFHGWLGGVFFYTVVNRDPFLEVFGKYLNF